MLASASNDAFRFICSEETSVMICNGAKVCVSPLAIHQQLHSADYER